MTRPVIDLAARLAAYQTPGVTSPRGAVGSAAGRLPRAGRPRALRRRHRATPLPWRLVDRFGAWVREVGLLVLGLVGVVVWAVSLAGTAVLVGGAS